MALNFIKFITRTVQRGAFLKAQWVKNTLATQKTQETHVRSLDRKDPGGGNGNPLQYSCLENPMDRVTWWAIVQKGRKELDTTE